MDMEWESITQWIDPNLMVVVVACWVIGYALKQTPSVPNWSIVYAVTVAAVVIVSLLTGFNAESVIQGVLCGGVAVYGHQLVNQGLKALSSKQKD